MKLSLNDIAEALDAKYGNIELDLGEAGSFSLTRLGMLVGKQKDQHETLTRKHLELLEEAQKAPASGERSYVDVAKDLAAVRVDMIVNCAGGSKDLRKWLDSQPVVRVDYVYDKIAKASEEGEG